MVGGEAQASATSQCPGPPASIRGPGPAPGSQPTKFHLLTGWLAQPRWYSCSEHLGQFHPALWPDTDAAAAGADAAAGEEDVTDEGGAAVGGGGGEVKGVPIWVQKPQRAGQNWGFCHTKIFSPHFAPQCAAAATPL